MSPSPLLAQTKKLISGTVSDEKGTALAGAVITVTGTKVFTLSGTDGKYSLNAPDNSKTITVTYVGMTDAVVSITGKTNVDVTLTTASTTLNDVVVIGYGTQKRANITSAISSIGEKDIKNLPVAGIDQALQGKVSGVDVTTNTGQPGGGVSVRIRGITTVNGNDPLYVIDGVPVPSSTGSTGQDQLGGVAGQTTQSVLATLNPADILSVDILKDASAQAIYGAQGGNGVILITTKHGKSGEGKFDYDTYIGQQMIQKKLPLMNLQQYAEYYNSVVGEGSVNGLDTIGEFKHPELLGPGTDWQDAVFQTGNVQNHQLSFSGGQGKTTYYFSGNYFNQTGTVIGSGFNRYAARVSIDHQVKNWLKAGFTSNLSKTHQKITLTDGQQSVISLMLYNSPATPVKDVNGSYIATVPVQGVPFGNTQNPVALALLRDVTSDNTRAFGDAYAEIQVKDFTLRNQFNYDYQGQENKAFQPSLTNPADGQLIIGPNRIRLDKANSYYYGIQTYLTYNHSFGKHDVNVVAGHESGYSNYGVVYASATATTLNLESVSAGTPDPSQTGSGIYENSSESFFGRLNYTYDNKYSLSASVRRDGSSNFGPDKRWGTFPAVSAGWTITNENFAKNWKGNPLLKIRAGVGSTGISSASANSYTTNIRLASSTIGLFGQSSPAGVPANVGNPFLSWESVVTYNAGLDASILHRRVDITLDVYKKVTTNMILSTTLPSFAGLDPNPPNNGYQEIEPPVTNAGQMTNTGIDLGITTHNITNKNFTWSTTIIFSHYKNVLDKLTTPTAALYGKSIAFAPQTLTVTQAGQSVGNFYGFVTDGLYRSQSELNSGPAPELPVGVQGTWLGDIRYKDLNGDKKITSADQTFLGSPDPKFTGGFTNSFTYKAFTLSIFLTGVYGDKIFNYSRLEDEALFSVYQNQLTTVMDRYTATNPGGTLPRYNQFNKNNLKISDRYIEDGSYLRIQNVAFGYNLPTKLISKIKMASARIYVSGQNLYTFTKYSGYDPELGSYNGNVLNRNIDYGHYPNPRSVTVGANIEF